MNDILKQRLVGALILLALGVVFWPIIFVQPEDQQVANQPAIPSPPAVSTEPIAPPDAEGLRASPPLESADEGADVPAGIAVQENPATGSAESVMPTQDSKPGASVTDITAAPEAPATREEAPQKLTMDNAGVPVAWTLQVATVSAAEKAETLRQKLLAMHHKAYVTTVSSGGKTLYRVCIGPKFERVELEKLQPVINTQFGVNTMVVRYVP